MSTDTPHFAVVGAGIAGLSAAWQLSGHGEVTVYDPGPPGGKLVTATFGGRRVDLGPDALLTRVSEGMALCDEVGLGDDLVAPAARRALLWSGDGLSPLPEGLVLGVPRRLASLRESSAISSRGVLRAALDLVLPRAGGGDVAVYDLVARRLGPEVADRLVDPLVSSIHAGRSRELSAQATTPQLFAAAQGSRSLMRALRAAPAGPPGPVFLAPREGIASLAEALVRRLSERDVAFRRVRVDQVRAGTDGLVRIDDGDGPLNGVVLAVEAGRAASLLGVGAPLALRRIPTASVSLVLMSFDAAELEPPSGVSGFLVPPRSGRLMTACSFASSKWPQWAIPGQTLLRISTGRHGDRRQEHFDDDELVARLSAEVNAALGVQATPSAARVVRWPDAFPQYLVGHLGLVDAIESGVARLGPVAVAGASYRGVGIPACIRSGRNAAEIILAESRARAASPS